MKTRYLLLLIPFIGSCGMPGGKGGYVPKDDTIRFVTDSICMDLTGISNYQIGKTTYRQVLNDKKYKDCTSSYERKSSFKFSNWISGFGVFDRNEEKVAWIDKNAKEIKSLVTSSFKIDDLEFIDFDFAFLNDTLVAVYFRPNNLNLSSEYNLKKHFQNKYGTGSWKKYSKQGNVKYGDTKYTESVDFEEILWKGNNVILKFYDSSRFVYDKDYKYFDMASYSSEYFIVYSIDRYPEFINRLKDASKAYDDQEKAKKEATLNSL